MLWTQAQQQQKKLGWGTGVKRLTPFLWTACKHLAQQGGGTQSSMEQGCQPVHHYCMTCLHVLWTQAQRLFHWGKGVKQLTPFLSPACRHMAQHDFQGSKDVRLLIMYSEALSHLIYAAADFVLVPSMFEPCGLTQVGWCCAWRLLPPSCLCAQQWPEASSMLLVHSMTGCHSIAAAAPGGPCLAPLCTL